MDEVDGCCTSFVLTLCRSVVAVLSCLPLAVVVSYVSFAKTVFIVLLCLLPMSRSDRYNSNFNWNFSFSYVAPWSRIWSSLCKAVSLMCSAGAD
jgi:hypothetical protein